MTTDHLSTVSVSVTVSCSTCSHFAFGHCRRFPPITMHGGWPRIESPKVESCGEHRPVETTPIGVMANGKYERPVPIGIEVETPVVEPELEPSEPAPVLSFTQSPRRQRPKST